MEYIKKEELKDGDVFVVKEPEFVLPKKWCLKITRENLDFCKSLENNELKFHKILNRGFLF